MNTHSSIVRVILKCNGENFRDSETRGMVSLSCEERREGGGSQLEPREGGVGSPQARHRAPRAGRGRCVLGTATLKSVTEISTVEISSQDPLDFMKSITPTTGDMVFPPS